MSYDKRQRVSLPPRLLPELADARRRRYSFGMSTLDRETSPKAAEHDGALVELNALLGAGTRYTGKLYFDGRTRIEGYFEGDIRGDGVLVIGDGAEVIADIEVGVCVIVGGTVRGNIRAREAIELHVPAVVVGDLHAPNVFIDRGVQFEGNCRMAALDGAGDVAKPDADEV
jgi:cytoskeletal protein CcmA (bactofilin family)